MEHVSVVVYGADVICASCVNAPTSKDIYDWLQPLLKRKYPNISFKYTYIDITKDNDNLTDHDLQPIKKYPPHKIADLDYSCSAFLMYIGIDIDVT
ncbi:DUF1462 family protein, partial [Staphylococcus aureus]